MPLRHQWQRLDGSTVEVALTQRADGDFHIDATPENLERYRERIFEGPWSVVRQVHGDGVVRADPTMSPAADGVFTDVAGQVIAVQGADCAPIGFVTSEGPIGVVHAGWRGLAAGVVESMATALRDNGAQISNIIVGPTIGVSCYEFGERDLDAVADALGDEVRGLTAEGTPALDLAAGISSVCARLGLPEVEFLASCSACTPDAFYSHRARRDPQRHAMALRIANTGAA